MGTCATLSVLTTASMGRAPQLKPKRTPKRPPDMKEYHIVDSEVRIRMQFRTLSRGLTRL